MLAKLLLPGLLTTAAVTALPSPDTSADGDLVIDEAHGELEIFKRDSILTARDLELADLHGVNLTESKGLPITNTLHLMLIIYFL